MAFCAMGREAEHSSPEHFIEKTIDSTAAKIGFEFEKGNTEEIIKQEWVELNDGLEKEKNPTISLDEFSLKVFKKITKDFGGLSNETLEKKFKEIIIEKQVQETIKEAGSGAEKKEIYEALGKMGVQAKQEGLDITKEMAEEIKRRVIIENQVQKTIKEIGPKAEEKKIYEALGKMGVQAKQEGLDITPEMAEEIKTRVKEYFLKEKK